MISSAVFVVGCAVSAWAQGLKTIRLPPPEVAGGKPLMAALKERRSSREFDPRPLPPQILSNLLWAACGINRPDSGKRTAPSASDKREIDVYLVARDGVYRYDAQANELAPVAAKDIRALTGTQPFVAEAPVNLVYVADLSRMGSGTRASKDFYSAADAGFVAENVYLYCASAGLATVVRGAIDKPALAKGMGLGPSQRIVLAQSVGFPDQETPEGKARKGETPSVVNWTPPSKIELVRRAVSDGMTDPKSIVEWARNYNVTLTADEVVRLKEKLSKKAGQP